MSYLQYGYIHELLRFRGFMTIAEDIGYGVKDRNINNNELIEIGKELSKFISYINQTEK